MSLLERLKTHEDSDAAIRQALIAQKEFFQRSLFLTAKCLLGYKDMTAATHSRVTNALESTKLRKLIVMPRGTFKSSICSVAYPIWLLLNNPNLRILLDSELYTNSKNFLREIKAHLTSERMERVFGKFQTRECWNEGEIIISQRTKTKKEASITCSGIGAEKTGQHYDVVVMDDLNSPNNSNTPEGCVKVVSHYRHLQAILDPGGILVIVGTRYSDGDLISHCLKTEIMDEKDSQVHQRFESGPSI